MSAQRGGSAVDVLSGQHRALVVDCRTLCDEHRCLRISVGVGFRAVAGQFVQVLCRAAEGVPGGGAYLRRPFSLAGVSRERGRSVIDLVYRVIGPGTAWLSARRAGDEVDIVGPLGRGFSIDRGCAEALLIAGGVGHPPLLMLAEELARRDIRRLAFCGAGRASLLPFTFERAPAPVAEVTPLTSVREWAATSTPVILSTEDGSAGFCGTVVQALEAYLAANPVQPGRLCIYACGPAAMLKAVADEAARCRVRCEIALETLMACGMGTCQSCVVRVRDGQAPEGWRYKLCCTEGPVFAGEEIIW